MTSEVVLMNRRAVALAADSATTITRWVRGEAKRRYFKGTNKLFHLSHVRPVGLMINGSGSMQGVPWEVLVKCFRDTLDGGAFDSLSKYGEALLNWVEKNSDAYPQPFLVRQFLSEVIECVGRITQPGMQAMQKTTAKKKKREILTEKVMEEVARVHSAPLLANATQDDLAKALEEYRAAVELTLTKNPFWAPVCQAVGADTLTEAALQAVFKKGHTTLDETGIIVAGYGNREYFPSIEAYTCYGNVLGKLLFEKDDSDCRKIDQGNISEVVPFAKSDMIYTFMFGASVRGLVEIDKLNRQALDRVEDKIRKSGLIKPEETLDEIKNEVHQEFRQSANEHFRSNHMSRLREVVGMLPVEELAELSEILVLIESIKERVTTDEESVSGPIDVALISKNDGFVWIKRKHYFKPELNPRYFARIRDLMRRQHEQEPASDDRRDQPPARAV